MFHDGGRYHNKNQTIDLLDKSMGWFLQDRERDKKNLNEKSNLQ